MKYLTTLEAAQQLGVSKQTLLNWLYAGKVPEPPRNKKGYRLWSASRLAFVQRLIGDGRIHKRTVVHAEAGNRPREYAREVQQFLRDGRVDVDAFLDELARLNSGVAQRLGARKPAPPAPRAASGGRGAREG